MYCNILNSFLNTIYMYYVSQTLVIIDTVMATYKSKSARVYSRLIYYVNQKSRSHGYTVQSNDSILHCLACYAYLLLSCNTKDQITSIATSKRVCKKNLISDKTCTLKIFKEKISVMITCPVERVPFTSLDQSIQLKHWRQITLFHWYLSLSTFLLVIQSIFL